MNTNTGAVRFKACEAATWNSFDGSRTFFGVRAMLDGAGRSYRGEGTLVSVWLGATYTLENRISPVPGRVCMTYVVGTLRGGGTVVLGVTDCRPSPEAHLDFL